MGFLPEMPPEAGEYHVEVRRESFYLAGEDPHWWVHEDALKPRHAISMYPQAPDGSTDIPIGTIEILIEDIPKIRACLDTVEAVLAARSNQ